MSYFEYSDLRDCSQYLRDIKSSDDKKFISTFAF